MVGGRVVSTIEVYVLLLVVDRTRGRVGLYVPIFSEGAALRSCIHHSKNGAVVKKVQF